MIGKRESQTLDLCEFGENIDLHFVQRPLANDLKA